MDRHWVTRGQEKKNPELQKPKAKLGKQVKFHKEKKGPASTSLTKTSTMKHHLSSFPHSGCRETTKLSNRRHFLARSFTSFSHVLSTKSTSPVSSVMVRKQAAHSLILEVYLLSSGATCLQTSICQRSCSFEYKIEGLSEITEKFWSCRCALELRRIS